MSQESMGEQSMDHTQAALDAATKNLRGTWPQALGSLALTILFLLSIRWALLEPYVIPSGSMIPTLLVHDHIFVNKFAYGIRLPFTSHWLVKFGIPTRGEVIVFRSVEDDSVFIVKRVIGIPGDEISIDENGQLSINGEKVPRRVLDESEIGARLVGWQQDEREQALERWEFAEESLGHSNYLTLREKERAFRTDGPFTVPEGALFMMGDNRDNSADSRVWGVLPMERVLGRASWIFLACESTLPEANQLCDPSTARWKRFFEVVR